MNRSLIFLALFVFQNILFGQVSISNIQNTQPNACQGIASIAVDQSLLPVEVTVNGPSQSTLTIETVMFSINELCEGAYTISYTDEFGCAKVIGFSIEACPSFDVTFNVTKSCPNRNDGTISSNLPSGVFIQWENGSTSSQRQYLKAATYVATLFDENNCQEIIEVEVEETQLSINILDIVVPDLLEPGGLISLDIDAENEPLSLNWSLLSCTPYAHYDDVQNSMQINGESLRFIGFESAVFEVEITDALGCKITRRFTLEHCTEDNNSIESIVDFVSSSTCENGMLEQLVYRIVGGGDYIHYTLTKANDANFLIEGTEEHKGRLTFENVEEGEYTLTIEDECNNTFSLIYAIECESCPSQFNHQVFFVGEFGNNESACDGDFPTIVSNYYSPILNEMSNICSYLPNGSSLCLDEAQFQVKMPDGAIYMFSTDDGWQDMLITEIRPGNTSFIYNDLYINYPVSQNGIYYIDLYFGLGCNFTTFFNVELTDEHGIKDNFLVYILGDLAQVGHFNCSTCVEPFLYEDFLQWNLPILCNDNTLTAELYDYEPNDANDPCGKGGIFFSDLLGLVTIPQGTPYVYVPDSEGLPEHEGCVKCLFYSLHGAGPILDGIPVYVAHCVEDDGGNNGPPSYPTDGSVDYSEDCETETFDFVGDCYIDVICSDDPDDEWLIQTNPNFSTVTACRDLNAGNCEVVGWCLESDDYFIYNGEVYVFDYLSCELGGFIPLCTEVESGDYTPIGTPPATIICYHDRCGDGPTDKFQFIWDDINYDLDLSSWQENFYDVAAPTCESLEIDVEYYISIDDVDYPDCFFIPDDSDTAVLRIIHDNIPVSRVYPNPFSDDLTIQFDQWQEVNDLHISILSVEGRTLFSLQSENLSSQNISITPEISSGYYILSLAFNNGVVQNHNIVVIE